MKNRQRMFPIHFRAMVLLGLAAAVCSTVPTRAQLAVPFKITSSVVKKDGTAALQWQGRNTNIVVQFTADVASPQWQPVPGVEWPIAGTNWSGVLPISVGKGFLRIVTTDGVGTAPIPMKTISLTLIGWHDLDSDKFMANCIACHGTRTQERALDGLTPTAHSTMLGLFSQGNDRCYTCHYNWPGGGPNLLTDSAGALRKQLNYEVNECTSCHDKGSLLPFYDR
jgi:hypothetical protein